MGRFACAGRLLTRAHGRVPSPTQLLRRQREVSVFYSLEWHLARTLTELTSVYFSGGDQTP